jgi:hypothetical protein
VAVTGKKEFQQFDILTAADTNAFLVNDPRPNFLINGGFDVFQRATSGTNFSGGQYVADRWRHTSDTASPIGTISRRTFTPGNSDYLNVGLPFFLRVQVTNLNGSTGYGIQNRIERVESLAGQTVTLSFWAKSDATRTNSYQIQQNFGAGGSASVDVAGSFETTTSWQRFMITETLADLTGKTIGTSSYLEVKFNPALAVSTFDIAAVQLEPGSGATPFRRAGGTIQGELAACQRYFEKVETYKAFGTAQFTTSGYFDYYMNVFKRSVPSVTFKSTTYTFDITAIAPKTGTSQGVTTNNDKLLVWYVAGSSGLTIGQNLTWTGGEIWLDSEV